MRRIAIVFVSFLLVGIWLSSLPLPAAASPDAQVVYDTPTPGPDGRILYIVKPNDTCIRIALLHQITEEQLRSLNNIRGQNCIVVVGQELLIGYAGPAESPTPGPSATPTPLLPTSTPLPGKASVCVILFEDVNGNGLFEESESLLLGGQVSITDRSGTFSKTGTTLDDPANPLCFQDVIEGSYTISMAIPQGYNPTTSTSRTLLLQAGDTSTLDFGAQISLKAPPSTAAPESASRIPIFGFVGVVLIGAGIGLAVYLRRTLK
jgi:hypothetical protein